MDVGVAVAVLAERIAVLAWKRAAAGSDFGPVAATAAAKALAGSTLSLAARSSQQRVRQERPGSAHIATVVVDNAAVPALVAKVVQAASHLNILVAAWLARAVAEAQRSHSAVVSDFDTARPIASHVVREAAADHLCSRPSKTPAAVLQAHPPLVSAALVAEHHLPQPDCPPSASAEAVAHHQTAAAVPAQ